MSLLPRLFQLPADIPLVLKRASQPASAEQPRLRPVCDWACATPRDGAPKKVRLRLTEEAQAEADEFRRFFGDGNCSCHLSPPCGSCTHPGHPLNLDESDDAWVLGYAEESEL